MPFCCLICALSNYKHDTTLTSSCDLLNCVGHKCFEISEYDLRANTAGYSRTCNLNVSIRQQYLTLLSSNNRIRKTQARHQE